MASGTRRRSSEPQVSRSPARAGDAASQHRSTAALRHAAGSSASEANAAQSADNSVQSEGICAESTSASARRAGGFAAAADSSPDPHSRTLAQALESLDLHADPATQATLLAYLAMLAKWNTTYNLTAIRDPAAMLVQHLFDCLAIVPALRSRRLLDDAAQVIDVGSGGGLPGVVLAALAPGATVHCVDAVGKKAAFVAQVRAELGLSNLHAHHARIESLRAPRDLAPATLIVSRAYATLDKFTSQSRHLLAPGGAWAAMKGQYPDDEVGQLPANVELAATIKLAVPMLDAQRHLLVLRARA